MHHTVYERNCAFLSNIWKARVQKHELEHQKYILVSCSFSLLKTSIYNLNSSSLHPFGVPPCPSPRNRSLAFVAPCHVANSKSAGSKVTKMHRGKNLMDRFGLEIIRSLLSVIQFQWSEYVDFPLFQYPSSIITHPVDDSSTILLLIITMLIFWCFTSGDVFIWLDLSTGWSLFFFVIHKAPNDWGWRCFSLQKIFMQMVGSTASGLPWKAKNCQVMHQRSSLKIDSRTDYQKPNQWFRDIVGLETKVCPEIVCRILVACLVTKDSGYEAKSSVTVLAGFSDHYLATVNIDW